jgi:hypothetical protein
MGNFLPLASIAHWFSQALWYFALLWSVGLLAGLVAYAASAVRYRLKSGKFPKSAGRPRAAVPREKPISRATRNAP